MRKCPRCVARAAVAVPMYETPEPARISLFRRPSREREPPIAPD